MKVLVLSALKRTFEGRDGDMVKLDRACVLEAMETLDAPHEKGNATYEVKVQEKPLDVLLEKGLPAVFDVEFGRRPGARGKPESFIISAKFVKAWDVQSVVA